MVLGVAVVMFASLVLSSVLNVVQTSSKGAEGIVGNLSWLWQILSIVVSIGLSTLILLVIFRTLPRCGVRLSEVWLGALVTAVGWEILKQGFAFYLGNFAKSASVYGTFGALFSLLTWIYLTGFILLVGSEFTSEYARAQRKLEGVQDVHDDGETVVPAGPSASARAWRASSLGDAAPPPLVPPPLPAPTPLRPTPPPVGDAGRAGVSIVGLAAVLAAGLGILLRGVRALSGRG
jgi:hypothetical protein